MFIDDIFFMDKIFSYERKITEQTGFNIINVSHWNSSYEFQQYMAQSLVTSCKSLPWDYYYTYSISTKNREKVLKKLGVDPKHLQSTMGLLLQSSTIAIVNVINLLVKHHRNRLCILQPSYFSVPHCCSNFSLKYGFEQLELSNMQFKIPVEKIIEGGYDCVWITSPLFCTGYYYNETQLEQIDRLRNAGLTVIFDESLALPGKELIRHFPIDNNTFAIYSPHKAISINGLKFSVIICSKHYEEFLEQWVDVFSGALSCSNRDAVLHFVSPNFHNECVPSYMNYIDKNKAVVLNIIKQYPFISSPPDTYGHYISLFSELQFKSKKELFLLISNIIKESFCSFIPNEYVNKNFLSFRVNLTGDTTELSGAIGRILESIRKNYY